MNSFSLLNSLVIHAKSRFQKISPSFKKSSVFLWFRGDFSCKIIYITKCRFALFVNRRINNSLSCLGIDLVQILCKYCANIMKILYIYCVIIVKILANILQVLRKNMTYNMKHFSMEQYQIKRKYWKDSETAFKVEIDIKKPTMWSFIVIHYPLWQ